MNFKKSQLRAITDDERNPFQRRVFLIVALKHLESLRLWQRQHDVLIAVEDKHGTHDEFFDAGSDVVDEILKQSRPIEDHVAEFQVLPGVVLGNDFQVVDNFTPDSRKAVVVASEVLHYDGQLLRISFTLSTQSEHDAPPKPHVTTDKTPEIR